MLDQIFLGWTQPKKTSEHWRINGITKWVRHHWVNIITTTELWFLLLIFFSIHLQLWKNIVFSDYICRVFIEFSVFTSLFFLLLLRPFNGVYSGTDNSGKPARECRTILGFAASKNDAGVGGDQLDYKTCSNPSAPNCRQIMATGLPTPVC